MAATIVTMMHPESVKIRRPVTFYRHQNGVRRTVSLIELTFVRRNYGTEPVQGTFF